MTPCKSHPATLAGLAFAAALLSCAGAAARTADYDGNWSVLIITDAGSCERSYRYGLNVENGEVRYRGDSGVDVRGRVDDRGRVRVLIGSGDGQAEGVGRLGGDTGSGVWRGSSPSNRCSGRWEAERR